MQEVITVFENIYHSRWLLYVMCFFFIFEVCFLYLKMKLKELTKYDLVNFFDSCIITGVFIATSVHYVNNIWFALAFLIYVPCSMIYRWKNKESLKAIKIGEIQ